MSETTKKERATIGLVPKGGKAAVDWLLKGDAKLGALHWVDKNDQCSVYYVSYEVLQPSWLVF